MSFLSNLFHKKDSNKDQVEKDEIDQKIKEISKHFGEEHFGEELKINPHITFLQGVMKRLQAELDQVQEEHDALLKKESIKDNVQFGLYWQLRYSFDNSLKLPLVAIIEQGKVAKFEAANIDFDLYPGINNGYHHVYNISCNIPLHELVKDKEQLKITELFIDAWTYRNRLHFDHQRSYYKPNEIILC